MKDKILVAYASKYGSTREVAEAVAASLSQCGLEVDLQPASKVQSLQAYTLVVLGAPLYFGAWHKDALNFLARHQEALAHRPVAVFALGPTHPDENGWQASRAMLEKELGKFGWLTPLAVGLFGGKYDPARLGLPDRLVASLPASPLHGLPASDIRNWAEIRSWAGSLSAQLQPGLAPAGA